MPVFNHQMLQKIRLELGLTQEQAAASLEIDERTYRRYESGAVNESGGFSVRHPSRYQFLQRLCAEFGVAGPNEWLLDSANGPAFTSAEDEARLKPLIAEAPGGTHGAAASEPPLISAHTTGREALRIALRLDRTKQWEQLKGECNQRRHALFLLFGYKKQNLCFFLDRIRHYLAEERRDHHLVLDLPWDRGGEISVTGLDLLSRLDQQLSLALSSGPGAAPIRDRLRQVTALRPLLIIVGENPIDELPAKRNRALADFLGHVLPAELRGLGTPHPVRVLLCVDYLDPARSCVGTIAGWAERAANRKKDPGLHYCQLPEAVLPNWTDVEKVLLELKPPLPQRRIQRIRNTYDELHRMDTPNFFQIAQVLNTELGD